MYGQLNLISKPMQIYNTDETRISVVHKPGKVAAELGHRNVYTLTSAERGKTHTVLTCLSFWSCFAPNDGISPEEVCSSRRVLFRVECLLIVTPNGIILTSI